MVDRSIMEKMRDTVSNIYGTERIIGSILKVHTKEGSFEVLYCFYVSYTCTLRTKYSKDIFIPNILDCLPAIIFTCYQIRLGNDICV